MSASAPYQRPPYGEILSNSVYPVVTVRGTGIGRFLSQGIAAGAAIYFLILLTIILSKPPISQNFVFIFLPFVLVWGMLLGIFEGLVIWACTELSGRRLNAAVRGAIGILTLILMPGIFLLFFKVRLTDLLVLAVFSSTGVAYGLVTGSRLEPWRELVRGSAAAKSRVLTGITGLALRSLLILGLMASILAVVCTLKQTFNQRDFAFALIALCHFTVASVIVFARIRFWLLLPLALLVNFPIVLLITEVLKNENPVYRYFVVSYLAIWGAFLLVRCSLTYSALTSLKEELRYYLID
ncbi:MAG TPA: hypothetical protein VJ751_11705 [Pyrinomonadaceae bacterium]|jgi:hypothetical protein|nr:hypothetical protein [Pyrinomonadaceae bacterium]